jgi:hypothetical protein
MKMYAEYFPRCLYAPPRLHDVTTQKTIFSVLTAMTTLKLITVQEAGAGIA